jgi:23S rRNA (cytosine1962-C5)-methyltransferase
MRMRVSIAKQRDMLRPMSQPAVTVSARGAERLRQGHPWIYQSDIRKTAAEPGDLVRVMSERGRPLGSAFWSSESQISLRFLGTEEVKDEREMLRSRLAAALAFRQTLDIDGTAWRAVNAEGDRLPGLVVDVYGADADRVVVVQTLTQAMDRRLGVIGELVAELLAPRGILARNDQKVRRLEGLGEQIDVVSGVVPDAVDVREGPIEYSVDVRHGQKTGLFLDQRENHDAAARYAKGRGLDAFTYNGGFAMRLAGRCASVLALDSSSAAVAATQANAARNRLTNIEVQEANVFDALRELEIARERFDTIVLDPPAFAKNKAALERAAAGYKEINLRALKVLTPGGCLITCTCSYHVYEELFQDILEQAAEDAHATVSIVERRMQARDHPILLNVPETHYLKCFVLRKLS